LLAGLSRRQRRIHYTVNGAEPTDVSPVYMGPFTINGDVSVKAKAYREGFLESTTRNVFYELVSVATPQFNPSGGSISNQTEISHCEDYSRRACGWKMATTAVPWLLARIDLGAPRDSDERRGLTPWWGREFALCRCKNTLRSIVFRTRTFMGICDVSLMAADSTQSCSQGCTRTSRTFSQNGVFTPYPTDPKCVSLDRGPKPQSAANLARGRQPRRPSVLLNGRLQNLPRLRAPRSRSPAGATAKARRGAERGQAARYCHRLLISEPGRPCIKELRSRFPQISVISLSVRTDADTINRCYEAGVSAYFVKPLDFSELVSTVAVITGFLKASSLQQN
jgi:hypothetical protein